MKLLFLALTLLVSGLGTPLIGMQAEAESASARSDEDEETGEEFDVEMEAGYDSDGPRKAWLREREQQRRELIAEINGDEEWARFWAGSLVRAQLVQILQGTRRPSLFGEWKAALPWIKSSLARESFKPLLGIYNKFILEFIIFRLCMQATDLSSLGTKGFNGVSERLWLNYPARDASFRIEVDDASMVKMKNELDVLIKRIASLDHSVDERYGVVLGKVCDALAHLVETAKTTWELALAWHKVCLIKMFALPFKIGGWGPEMAQEAFDDQKLLASAISELAKQRHCHVTVETLMQGRLVVHDANKGTFHDLMLAHQSMLQHV